MTQTICSLTKEDEGQVQQDDKKEGMKLTKDKTGDKPEKRRGFC